MKLEFKLRSHGFYYEGFYMNGQSANISLCRNGVREFFNCSALNLIFDIRLKNPKEKGFKCIRYAHSDNIKISKKIVLATQGTVNLINSLGGTVWVKVTTIF